MAITVARVIRVTLEGRMSDSHVADVVIDLHADNADPGQARSAGVDAAVLALVNGWQDHVVPQTANNYTFTGAKYLDLNAADGDTGEVGPTAGKATAGSENNAGAPPNVAVLVRKRTSSGRGKRGGRIYMPGVLRDFCSSDGKLTDSGLSTYQTAFDALLAAVNLNLASGGIPNAGDTSNMVVCHFGPRPPKGTPDNRVGTATNVTSLDVQRVLATQRRRLR